MDSGRHVGQPAPDLQKSRLRAAKKLLRIMEEHNGKIEDEADFMENLSRRQEVIVEILSLQKQLKEIRRLGAYAVLPEEEETAAQADSVLLRIRELNQKDIDEVSKHLQLYKIGFARLKMEKKGLEAYQKSGAYPEKRHFDAHG
ncbi:MAG: hypothetical protein AB7C97_03120 [Oscillospiraceae bacterium]